MNLQTELGLVNPIRTPAHEAILNIVMTGEILAKEGDRLLRPFGLTDTQFNVLMLLRFQSVDGRINQTQLGRMMLVNRSNITGLVDRMEQAGWVKRHDQKGDRRVKMIALTPKGSALLDKADRAYTETVENLVAGLGEPEIKKLCRVLEKLRERLPRPSED